MILVFQLASYFCISEKRKSPYARHTKLFTPPAKIMTECHEEWELDVQGGMYAGVPLKRQRL
ncbi:MAG TPA: hypothetical protein DCG54_08520 [Anaerolineae bacterium]|jgi:hypothetical protein|nr:hypothetical protein [Anaerolineae bacterium]